MKIVKAITLSEELIVEVKDEADKNHRSFSNMVEHILRSHYTKEDRIASGLQ